MNSEKIIEAYLKQVEQRVLVYFRQIKEVETRAALAGKQMSHEAHAVGFILAKLAGIELIVERIQKELRREKIEESN